jgi:hypothetical protein
MRVALDIALGMNLPEAALGFQTTDELPAQVMKPDSTTRMVATNRALWQLV